MDGSVGKNGVKEEDTRKYVSEVKGIGETAELVASEDEKYISGQVFCEKGGMAM